MPDLFDDDFDAASPVPEAAAAASPIDLFTASTPQGGGGAPSDAAPPRALLFDAATPATEAAASAKRACAEPAEDDAVPGVCDLLTRIHVQADGGLPRDDELGGEPTNGDTV